MGAYNDDVLFVHIPKCGGTAVKHYMVEHLDDVVWPRTRTWFMRRERRTEFTAMDEALAKRSVEEAKLPIGHVPLRDIPAFTGRPLDSWKTIIGVIRDPYEHQVSQWYFWRDRYARGQMHPHDILAGMCPRIDWWLEYPECDFHLWYEQRYHPDDELVRRPPNAVTGYADWGGYFWYWLSVDGALPDNVKILRQETLHDDLPALLDVDAPMPTLNTTNHGPHLEYYNTARALEIVSAKFRWVLDELQAYPRMVGS